MSAPFNVFVCSTFDDLERERKAVLDAIRLVQSRHNAMEFFGARPARPIDVCLDEVRKSDLLVVIVGEKYGSLPSEIGVSYSQAEYQEGMRLGKPCLVYLRDDDVRILPKHVERDPDKLRLLGAWKQELNASHTVAKFESWPRLAVRVTADIGNFLVMRATAAAKGVSEAPLREVLKRLGETEVAEAEIPDRLAKAADELIRLRADLVRLSNDRPEFATIRARASAAIDKGDLNAARAALTEGRERARALREEANRTEAGFLAQEARIDRLQLNYEAACAKFAEAAHLDPDNFRIWRELGDLWMTRGSLAEAKTAFFRARDAAPQAKEGRALAVIYQRIGGVQRAQGDRADALKTYRDAQTILAKLAKSDPSNGALRDLSVLHSKIGDLMFDLGDIAGALTSYDADLEIAERLAASDPDNSGWQRDLSVSYDRIGHMKYLQGERESALEKFNASLAIRERLAKIDPNNPLWQHDFGVGYERIGDVQRDQRDFAGALKSFRAKLAIFDRLARSDPGNAGLQRDFAASHAKIGNALLDLGNRQEALDAWQRGYALLLPLTAMSPENVDWKEDLDWFAKRMVDLARE
jgi:tetratricopeptide (TPR) repeat protein